MTTTPNRSLVVVLVLVLTCSPVVAATPAAAGGTDSTDGGALDGSLGLDGIQDDPLGVPGAVGEGIAGDLTNDTTERAGNATNASAAGAVDANGTSTPSPTDDELEIVFPPDDDAEGSSTGNATAADDAGGNDAGGNGSDVDGAVGETVEAAGAGTEAVVNATPETVDETVDVVEKPLDGTENATDGTLNGTANAVGETVNGTAGELEEPANATGGTVRATTDATTGTVEDATGGVTGTVDDATAATANATADVAGTVDGTASSTTGVVDGGDGALTGAIGNLTDRDADANLTTVVEGVTGVVRRTTDTVTDRVELTVATTGEVVDGVATTVTSGPFVADSADREAYSWATEPTAGATDGGGASTAGAAPTAPATGGPDANESAVVPGDDGSADETGVDEEADGGAPVPMPGVDPAGGGAYVGALALAGSLAATRSGAAASTMGAGATTLPRALLSLAREYLARFAVLAGYSRYDFEDPLENENRAVVLETVESSPGVNLTSLVEATGLPESTVRYHLRVLEHEGLLEGAKVRGRRRYVPRTDDDLELLAAFEEEATKDVLAALFEHEPATGTTLAEALERDPSTVSHHLSRLAEAGLVDRERDGPALRNSLAPAVRRAFSDVEVTSSVQGHVGADD